MSFFGFQNEKTGETALHYAVECKNENMIKKLLSRDADVKLETKSGDTPLHLINDSVHRELAKLLLDKGADIHVKNNAKKSPHDLADKTVCIYMTSSF